jgi:hypothetical protein
MRDRLLDRTQSIPAIMNSNVTYYSKESLLLKLKECVKLVRNLLGQPTNKLGLYNPNPNESSKFYVTQKQKKLEYIRNETAEDIADILQYKSGNCGEYEVVTNTLLQLKGFQVATYVEDFMDNDNHAYSVLRVRISGELLYYVVDSWKDEVFPIQDLPTENNAWECKGFSKQKQQPLSREYINQELYEGNKQNVTGKSSAASKLRQVETWL